MKAYLSIFAPISDGEKPSIDENVYWLLENLEDSRYTTLMRALPTDADMSIMTFPNTRHDNTKKYKRVHFSVLGELDEKSLYFAQFHPNEESFYFDVLLLVHLGILKTEIDDLFTFFQNFKNHLFYVHDDLFNTP